MCASQQGRRIRKFSKNSLGDTSIGNISSPHKAQGNACIIAVSHPSMCLKTKMTLIIPTIAFAIALSDSVKHLFNTAIMLVRSSSMLSNYSELMTLVRSTYPIMLMA